MGYPDDLRYLPGEARMLTTRQERRMEAADAAMAAAHTAAERVAVILDRRYGDAGDDPDWVRDIADKLTAIEREVAERIGDPAPGPRVARCYRSERNG